MKRGDKSRPDAILTSDWHLRENTPVCRTDDFEQTLWRKVVFIRELQVQYNCDVFHAGDLFDHWKPSPNLLSQAILFLPDKFHTVYGQHDLPQHNIQLSGKSGIRTLNAAGVVAVLKQGHWNQTPDGEGLTINNRRILVWHYPTYAGKKPFPGSTAPPALGLLKKYPQYDLIVTGDNHQPFVVKHEGRLLVNPGSLYRSTADQVDHKPRVYLWYAETNTVEIVYIPIEEGVISREHIDKVEQRNDRIDAFITTLDKNWKTARTFKDNLTHFTENNTVRKSVMDIVYKAIENE